MIKWIRVKASPFILTVVILFFCSAFPTSFVRADTNGTEIAITEQPDRLILELGNDWAGAEFELGLDAGVFPVPLIADDAGIITMDIGGSKTYHLTLVSFVSTEPEPEPVGDTEESISPNEPDETSEAPPSEPETSGGIPVAHLILFIGGLIVAIVTLAIMYINKKRQEYDDDDYYDEDEDE